MELSAALVERAGLRAWPGIEVDYDGLWIRRAANGYTQRANSVQCLDVTDEADAPARIAASAAWFSARGLKPIFRVTPLAGPAVIAALDAASWARVDDSHLFAMELGALEADPRGRLYDLLDPDFLAVQQFLRGYDDAKLEKLRALLAVIDVPARGIVIWSNTGAPVASALMAIAEGIVITGNVITASTQRRQGFGSALMRTGLAWARGAGADIAALNVAAENTAGKALYQSLGFRHQYDYTYRIPPTP
jgi:GNAT superfamily N-acetyltransferase